MNAGGRTFRAFMVAVMLLMGLAATMPPGSAAQPGANGEPGNSGAAKQCQKGGWQELAPAGDPYVPFASQGTCVSYGAQGGVIVALQVQPPTVTLSWFNSLGQNTWCVAVISVSGFEPGTYSVNLPTVSFSFTSQMLVGEDGSGSITTIGEGNHLSIAYSSGESYTASVGDVWAQPSVVAC